MQDYGQTASQDKAVAQFDPNPPRTEAPQMLQSELEQRHSEAMAKAEFHGAESRSWRSVAAACEAALKSLSAPQTDSQPERF